MMTGARSEGGKEGGTGGSTLKTKNPHKDVGNNDFQTSLKMAKIQVVTQMLWFVCCALCFLFSKSQDKSRLIQVLEGR